MEEQQTFLNIKKVCFSYPADNVKYYLLTGDSGYPLADFKLPGIPSKDKGGFIIPERITKTANTIQEP
ncbi:MAG: hypothetical protein BWY80_00277 [Firmicutes bacterium ADurb.Bin456]|nr:MAG: hypothetical protein BWY80_00277 [Firmicutes bacterium ADurb.Bin456]